MTTTQQVILAECLEWMQSQPVDRFDLTFGSPPYCDARTYGIDAQRDCIEWVDWMLAISEAAARITTGPVLWVVAGVTRKRCYWPAVEGLMWEWWKRGGTHEMYRPCAFHRVGIPGSGGDDWFRADWEFVVCLKRPGKLPWSDNTAMGHPPKYAPGGEMSYRLTDGTRHNQWGGVSKTGQRTADGTRSQAFRPSHRQHTKARADGEMEDQTYVPPAIANPGTVVSCRVGGGRMGSPLAHKNEAPFPEALAEHFVRSMCPVDGWVLDPFCGSGTTLAVCARFDRNAMGVDIRESQCLIATERIAQQRLF